VPHKLFNNDTFAPGIPQITRKGSAEVVPDDQPGELTQANPQPSINFNELPQPRVTS
jgi:hypothetical protein